MTNYRWLRTVVGLLGCVLLSACATKTPEPAPEISDAQQLAEQRRMQYEQQVNALLADWRDDALADQVDGFQLLTESYPEGVAAWVNLGVAYYRQGDLTRAARALEQAVELAPAQPQALTSYGLVLREQGQFAEAEAIYRRALEADPDYAPAVRNLAILLDLYRGQLVEALALYEHYASLIDEGSEPRLKDWIFDIRNRVQ